MPDHADAARSALDELYHGNSKHSPVRLGFASAYDVRRRDRAVHELYEAHRDRFKTYPASPRVALPRELLAPAVTLTDAIVARRSERRFAPAPLALEEIATLLARSYGTCGARGGLAARAVPSGGGLYPLDLYVLQLAGGACDQGVYHYHPGAHCLQRVGAGCARRTLEAASIYPEIVAQAPMLLAVVADMPRTRRKYGERAYRLALLEAGHVSQNLYLLAAALGLGIVALDGFYDDRLHAVLGVDGVSEIALLLFAVGRPG